MIANYHTHTARCGHARGQEREYVENAIAGGLKILGFSDHTPYPFPEDYKPRTRMAVSQFEDYVDTVLALKKEYAGQIEIHLGVEAEYYPKYFDALIDLYTYIGYPCFKVSALNETGIDEIKQDLQGKVTLLSGNSGVGKSTFINAILPELKVKTGEISDYHNKGMHTTTFSEMFPLEGGGYLIDTPGIKGFGTFDMEEEEVGHYFKEIFEYSADCKYGNCTHRHEPGCAVREAVEKHLISESRYASYLNMLEDKEEGKYRAAF